MLDAPQLTGNLNLRLNLAQSTIDTRLIEIPGSFLTSDLGFVVGLSKINAWPVDVYACVLRGRLGRGLSRHEALQEIDRLTAEDAFFSSSVSTESAVSTSENENETETEIPVSPSSSTITTDASASGAPNYFQKSSCASGPDLESLYFRSADDSIDENYWLVIAAKPLKFTVTSGAEVEAQQVLSSFPIHLTIDPMYGGVPSSIIPLFIVLLMVVFVYFGLLRKQHLKLFLR